MFADMLVKFIGSVVIMVMVVVGAGLFLSLPVMLLWNWCLIPAIPGVKAIGWFQAWGILILFGFLFKAKASTYRKETVKK